MTIRQLANRIIKEIKTWPEEAKQSQDIGSPKTSWDEYKEQIQYEEYDSFEVFEETIESMVSDVVSELLLVVIEKMYRSTFIDYTPATFEERRKDIICLTLSYIKSEAESQDIEYNKPEIEFVRYYINDLTIVAKVLSKVGPEEYFIHAYSEATGPGGEQGVVNLSTLEQECELEVIDFRKYHLLSQCFWPTPSGKTRKDLPKRKRVHSLKKHQQEMRERFLKLDQEAEARREIQDELRKKKDLDNQEE